MSISVRKKRTAQFGTTLGKLKIVSFVIFPLVNSVDLTLILKITMWSILRLTSKHHLWFIVHLLLLGLVDSFRMLSKYLLISSTVSMYKFDIDQWLEIIFPPVTRSCSHKTKPFHLLCLHILSGAAAVREQWASGTDDEQPHTYRLIALINSW